MALYFGRIRTRLEDVYFRVFRFAACSKPPSRDDDHRKSPYPRKQPWQQRVRPRWELDLDHAINITRSPQKRRFNPPGRTTDCRRHHLELALSEKMSAIDNQFLWTSFLTAS